MTNFERIRAMSVEEMAELLTDYDEDSDEYFSADGKCFDYTQASKAIAATIDWLNAEAKEWLTMLTDAQRRAVELMKKHDGRAYLYPNSLTWYTNYAIDAHEYDTMQSLARIGLVKIDGNIATLTEVHDGKVE